MKKLLSLLLISTSLLTACGKQGQETAVSSSAAGSSKTSQTSSSKERASSAKQEPTETSSSKEEQSTEENSSSSSQTVENKSASQSSSQQATEETTEPEAEADTQTETDEPAQLLTTNESLYASTLNLVASDPTRDPNLHYAFWDIDGNGTAELVTARIYSGVVYPEAIYYQQHGVSTYLARTYVAGGGGRRESFTIYTDGTVEWDEWSSGSGSGTAYLYQLAGDNSGHWLIGQQDFNQRELPNPNYVNQFGDGRAELNLASLWWNAF